MSFYENCSVSGQVDNVLYCLAHQFPLFFRDDDPLQQRANAFYEYSQSVLIKRIDAWATTSIDSGKMQENDQSDSF